MDEVQKLPLIPQVIYDTIEILIRHQKCLGARAAFLRQFTNIHEVHYNFKVENAIKELDNEIQGIQKDTKQIESELAKFSVCSVPKCIHNANAHIKSIR
ncbi:hypothetical protein NPIL_519331 [Nephila pilipes]|uniref:Uncharacterized protein n=1 Tax=Nephila pilipes TaxID=299642 RepID=A0A8X6TGP3_NEPPI|nr:hypothetical protein NPIL_519331 [Nephila pilipes]